MRAVRTTALAAAVALGLAGCADDEAEVVDEPTGEDTADTEEPEEGEADTEADGATVVVREIEFQEPSVLVAPDAPVTWDNQDRVDHTVTSGTPNEPTGVFDQELPAEGEVTITVSDPGTYPYYCRIHPQMTAELIVEPVGS